MQAQFPLDEIAGLPAFAGNDSRLFSGNTAHRVA
jgi:hypothetical protein